MLDSFSNNEIGLFNKLGFIKDQNGILRRYIRETEAWAMHLNKTKKTILDQATTKSKNKAAILGSEWLLDVPLSELALLFNEEWLFDACHPPQIKQQVSKLGNVKTIVTDISGLALPIFKLVNKKHSPDNAIQLLTPSFNFDLSEFDFVVSCNLLNQLDIILLDYISKHKKLPHDEETEYAGLSNKLI